jgi:septal ring factor EnvC (AmiA/AmiB activator)
MKEEPMSDFKENLFDILIVLLSIAVLMVLVYFQQSRQWNQSLKTSDQKIGDLDQKIAEHAKELATARDTIAGHEAASKNAAAGIRQTKKSKANSRAARGA